VVIAIIGLMAVVLAQVLSELLKKWLSRSTERAAMDRSLRDELREDITRLRNEVTDLNNRLDASEAEADQFQLKYWDEHLEFVKYKMKHPPPE
jgi:uncharacterized protein YlxW (UPF0749 family)